MRLTKNFALGINSYVDALTFIFKNKLIIYFIFPILLNILVFSLGIWGTSTISDWALTSINNLIHPETWTFYASDVIYKILEWSLWILIRIFFFFFYVWFGGYIILMLMSPVYAFLSEKVEEILTGKKFPYSLNQFIDDIIRGILLALRNLFIELGVTILLFILGFIPVIGWLTPIAIFIVASYYYGFSFLDYSLERKRMNIHSSSEFVKNNGGLAIANGAIFSLTLAIPYIGVLFAGFISIISVVAATIAIHEMDENRPLITNKINEISQ